MEKGGKLSEKQFRSAAVTILLKFTPQSAGISRISLFTAVSILDKYLCSIKNKSPEHSFIKKDLFPVALSCLRLAVRFHGDGIPKIEKLGELLKWKGDLDALQIQWSNKQMEVFQKIGFSIPHDTALASFNESLEKESVAQKKIIVTLKFLLLGLQHSSEMSLNPKYGEKILDYSLGKNSDSEIGHYLRKVATWDLNRKKRHSNS